MDIYNLISLIGMVVLIGCAWLFSANRREVNWHVIVWGVGLQMLLALFIFIVPAGTKFFLFLNDVVIKVLDSANAGSRFVFGSLAGETSLGFILAFQAFPTIIFFSSLMGILYFYNILPRLIRFLAGIFTKLMRVSGAEALCTASNIFVGVESALTIRPFLRKMTNSELCTVLTAGMASVSSNVMAIYVFSLKSVFPNIAGHLVLASFLSAPAALIMSKLILPETENPETLGENIELTIEKDKSLFETIIHSAQAGVQLVIGIVALLIAILGLVALFDQTFGFVGSKINQIFNWDWTWSLKNLMGMMFYPFVALLGVPLSDVGILAQIIGERTIVTEVVSYQDLAKAIADGVITHPRSIVVTTYALCGFAHVASLAIFVGGIAAIAPEKTSALAKVGLRSFIAATLACLMTACVAGLFFANQTTLLTGHV